MDEEQIEQIIASSKRMQEVGEFTSSKSNAEMFDALAESVTSMAQAMQEQTDLDDTEIVSALTGAVAGILLIWALEYE